MLQKYGSIEIRRALAGSKSGQGRRLAVPTRRVGLSAHEPAPYTDPESRSLHRGKQLPARRDDPTVSPVNKRGERSWCFIRGMSLPWKALFKRADQISSLSLK